MTVFPYPTRGVVTATDLSTDGEVFPQLPGSDFLMSRNPRFSTNVSRSSSGRTTRTSLFSSPIYTFKIVHNVLRDDASMVEIQKLTAFFNTRQGMFGSFFYLDSSDYQVTDEPFGTGDGSTATFQAQRSVGRGTSYARIEPIYAFWIAPTVKVAGVTTVPAAINPWGQITFTTPPANGAALTWSGKFLWVCAFTQDQLSVQQIVNGLWSQDGLTFESIKP